MTALIKAGSGERVRSFGERARIALNVAVPTPPAPSPEALQIAALRDEIAHLRRAAAADRTAAERAAAKAREDGKREAQELARRDDEKRLEVLSAGIAGARYVLDERIADLDGLAAQVARATIAKLFSGCDDHSQFVVGMIARQMQHLRRETVLTIRVSRQDFLDEVSLAALGAGAGTGGIAVVQDDELQSGQCRIDLQLGHLDLCSRSQWEEMAQLLHELSGAEAGV